MPEVSDIWYTITDWSGTTFDTTDKEVAKTALREDGEVVKNTRIVFEQGPTTFRMTASTDIYKIRDL